jgi:hypothetical protein
MKVAQLIAELQKFPADKDVRFDGLEYHHEIKSLSEEVIVEYPHPEYKAVEYDVVLISGD